MHRLGRRCSRRAGVLGTAVLLSVVVLGAAAGSAARATAPDGKLNIVFILIDDLGWADVRFMGNTFVTTPHLDRLAREGVVFTSAYANAPNCAPTRASLMTGQYTPRHGVYTVSDASNANTARQKLVPIPTATHLPDDSVTLAEALKSAGYATACFGMWNLGRARDPKYGPIAEGFDVFKAPESLGFGDPRSYLPAPRLSRDGRRRTPAAPAGQYLTDRLTDEALRFIEANRDGPFFVYLAHHAIHTPHEPRPDLLAKAQRGAAVGADSRVTHAAMVASVDESVGRVVGTLERLALTGRTLVIFFSDNGGESGRGKPGNAPLRDGKSTMYEGGIRVPLVVAGPATLQSGRQVDTPVMGADLYPTILDLAGVARPGDHALDGASLRPLLTGAGELARDALFFHFPEYVGRGTPCSAVRAGDFKLIEFFEDGGLELYNLADDLGETRNLVAALPDVTKRLHARLRAWRDMMDAPVPTQLNPDYDPGAARRGRRGGAGRR